MKYLIGLLVVMIIGLTWFNISSVNKSRRLQNRYNALQTKYNALDSLKLKRDTIYLQIEKIENEIAKERELTKREYDSIRQILINESTN